MAVLAGYRHRRLRAGRLPVLTSASDRFRLRVRPPAHRARAAVHVVPRRSATCPEAGDPGSVRTGTFCPIWQVSPSCWSLFWRVSGSRVGARRPIDVPGPPRTRTTATGRDMRRDNRRTPRNLRIALTLAGGAAVLGFGGLYATALVVTGDSVADGTHVQGVDIGGMSRTEATAALDRTLGPAASAPWSCGSATGRSGSPPPPSVCPSTPGPPSTRPPTPDPIRSRSSGDSSSRPASAPSSP